MADWSSYLPNPGGDRELWAEWRKLVNMTERQLQAFLKEYGDVAGLSRGEAKTEGVRSGRDSARALLRMIPKGTSYAQAEANWTATDWKWARRQVGFIKRMRGVSGSLHDADGEPTRKLLALKLWGHDPEKGLRKVNPRPRKAQLDRAVKVMQLYLGSVDYVSVRDQERLYRRAMKQVEKIADQTGQLSSDIWSSIEGEARRRGPVRPLLGKDL